MVLVYSFLKIPFIFYLAFNLHHYAVYLLISATSVYQPAVVVFL